jgi:2-hydroxy-6-oxonona-2,4-dienedioate hydrolase
VQPGTRRVLQVGSWRELTTPSAWTRSNGAGPCPAVVRVHGLGMSSRYLQRMLRLLGIDCREFGPDLPGFGGSSRPSGPLTLPEPAGVLVAWMDAAGLEQAALLGHSLGARSLVTSPISIAPSQLPGARQPQPQSAGPLAVAAGAAAVARRTRESPSLLPIAGVDYLWAGPRRMWRTLREACR